MTKLSIISIFFSLIFLILLGRLFYWQVIRAQDLADQAKVQYKVSEQITAPRGNILADDGTWLAARAEVWQVYAWLPDVHDASKIADALAPFFVEGDEHGTLLAEAGRIKELLGRTDVSWVPIKSRVENDAKKQIEKLGLSGIGFEPQETRVYPEASAAAHILGFVGKDEEGKNTGYFGLEGYYDLPLSGKPGFLERERDAIGSPIVSANSTDISATGGVDLLTHIDKAIQADLDKKLLEGIEKYGAVSGNVTVMDPFNGAILGSSAYPSYDPAKYYDFGNEFFKSSIVSDSFEPGSIFKVLVMAAGIDAGVVEPDTKCDICDGPLKIDKYDIKTWNNEYHPDSSMTDVIVDSDNVGMSFVAQKLGEQKLYEYLDNFGIGRRTGVDLQGEIDGSLRDWEDWTPVDLATVSFGQGVATTPIQMVDAVSVIANGGYQVTPQVVDKLVGPGWQDDIKPVLGKKVLSDDAVSKIKAMMVEATERGESKWTKVPGFKVAGKTGTAQIPIAGHYDAEKTNASFIGFAPVDKPKFVMLVTLSEPQTSPWAAETAAPLWYDIARDLFLHFGIQPDN